MSTDNTDNPTADALTDEIPFPTDPLDGRKFGEWESRYPKEVRCQMICEGVYLLVLHVIAYLLLFYLWRGDLLKIVPPEKAQVFKKYALYCVSGLLGGVIFGIKYFYRVIARKEWNQDRLAWRLKSPMIATTVALAVGCMLECSMLSGKAGQSGASILAIGFITGYFADQAVGKMHEVAVAIFGERKK